jgi:hypothetical protein
VNTQAFGIEKELCFCDILRMHFGLKIQPYITPTEAIRRQEYYYGSTVQFQAMCNPNLVLLHSGWHLARSCQPAARPWRERHCGGILVCAASKLWRRSRWRNLGTPGITLHLLQDGEHVTSHTLHVTRHTPHVTRHTPHATRHTSHVTRHTSHATRHTSHVTRHTSHATRHTSHVTRHTPHVTRHTPHATRHTPHATSHTSPVTRHTPHVTRHTSHATRHTPHVTRHTSHATREGD